MQISQQRSHLLIVETTGKAGHQSPAGEYIQSNCGVRCGGATGQSLALENIVQLWRDLLQCQVIVLVAMCAAHLVKMLPC